MDKMLSNVERYNNSNNNNNNNIRNAVHKTDFNHLIRFKYLFF